MFKDNKMIEKYLQCYWKHGSKNKALLFLLNWAYSNIQINKNQIFSPHQQQFLDLCFEFLFILKYDIFI